MGVAVTHARRPTMGLPPTPNPLEKTMAARTPVTDEAAHTASTTDLVETSAPAVTHDRATTPVAAGRIHFKGHTAAAGYPFRIYDGQVQALLDGEWVEAVDSVALTPTD